MAPHRAQVGFLVTLVVTTVVALSPPRFRSLWMRDFAEIARFPFLPFAEAGSRLSEWLRPPRSTAGEVPDEWRSMMEELIEDRDIAQQLYLGEHRRVLELEQQNRELQQIASDPALDDTRVVTAHVISRRGTATQGQGVVEVRLEHGAPYMVPEYTVAVHAGVYIVGWTIGDSSRGICSLLPIANKGNGPIRARLCAADDPNRPLEERPVIHLEPDGNGSFRGEVEHTVVVAEGDIVRLDDPDWRWHAAAQARVLGRVTSFHQNDREPLRNTIIVEPVFHLRELASVTLIIQGSIEGGFGTAQVEGGAP